MTTLDPHDFSVLFTDSNVKKVIFFDTCSLLDIVRLPWKIRENKGNPHTPYYLPDDYTKLLLLKRAVENGECKIVCSSVQALEIKNNINQALGDAKGVSSKYALSLDILAAIEGIILPPSVREDVNAKLKGIYDFFFNSLTGLNYDSNIITDAYERINRKDYPVANNDNDIHDSIIWETFMRLTKEPNPNNIKVVLLTSNTKHFVGFHGTILRLASEYINKNLNKIEHDFKSAYDF